jgi:hypothetical protein
MKVGLFHSWHDRAAIFEDCIAEIGSHIPIITTFMVRANSASAIAFALEDPNGLSPGLLQTELPLDGRGQSWGTGETQRS